MTSLLLYVGIAVTFLTVWGVIMVGGYLLGREPNDAPTAIAAGKVSEAPTAAKVARLR